MNAGAELSTAETILPLRTRHRAEMNCQIVHDSIHGRQGWSLTFSLSANGTAAGFASIAIAGPWKDKPTVYEFYVLPEYRHQAFHLFEAFLAVGQPRFLELQSNDALFLAVALAYAENIATESIVFHDKLTTALPSRGASLRSVTPEQEIHAAIERRQGGGEWLLELDGVEVGKGGLLFHYNRPYGDIYMEINEPFRSRGLGSYLVQELKCLAYSLGATPCARCNPTNRASQKTLQRAGFVPYAHILNGSIKTGDL